MQDMRPEQSDLIAAAVLNNLRGSALAHDVGALAFRVVRLVASTDGP